MSDTLRTFASECINARVNAHIKNFWIDLEGLQSVQSSRFLSLPKLESHDILKEQQMKITAVNVNNSHREIVCRLSSVLDIPVFIVFSRSCKCHDIKCSACAQTFDNESATNGLQTCNLFQNV